MAQLKKHKPYRFYVFIQLRFLGLLGQSTNMKKQSTLEIWTYSYTQENLVSKAYIPFADLAGEPPIILQSGNLTIAFNKSGIVENVASSSNCNK